MHLYIYNNDNDNDNDNVSRRYYKKHKKEKQHIELCRVQKEERQNELKDKIQKESACNEKQIIYMRDNSLKFLSLKFLEKPILICF